MCDYPLITSWFILGIGIGLLIISPRCIYNCGRVISSKNLTNAERDEKLTDRKKLLYYYLIAGITITIIGFLLVFIFSGKLSEFLNIIYK